MNKVPLLEAIRQMIAMSDQEIESFLSGCYIKIFQPKEFLSKQDEICHDIFFILRGTTRSLVIDTAGEEHTIHFSIENQFICDYTSFLLQTPATNSIQAVEETEVVFLPRAIIEWATPI